MDKKRFLLGFLLLLLLGLTGCRSSEENYVNGTGVFYLNTDGTGLVKEKCSIKGSTVEEQIKYLLKELQKETECIDYVRAIPEDVKIEKWELQGAMMKLYFNVNYNKLDSSSEVLLRAAVVQTLTQIQEVEYIAFYSAGQPVTDNEGKEIGYQSEEDFVQNIGSTLHSYQKGELKLYFANAKGNKLSSENVSVRYNSNMSIEKLIVEELIEGPMSSELKATFTSNTKVLGVSVKDQICYVNFDENFLKTPTAVDPALTVYSLVNSIIEGGTATKVQILVNGEVNVKYMEVIDFSQPFTRNLEIVEVEE